MTNDRVGAQQVVDEFSTALKEAEGLLEQVSSEVGDKAQTARLKLQEKLREAKYRLADLEDAARERGRLAVRVTDDYVHDNPWTAVAGGLVIGLVIGLLLGRR